MKNIILIINTLLIFTTISAQENLQIVSNQKETAELLIESSKNIKSICSPFIQEKHLEYLSSTIESEGIFWFRSDNKLRWEYISPFSYIIVASDGQFTIKDEEKTSVYDINSNIAFKELNEILISTVNGSLITSEKFNYKIYHNEDFFVVALIPKKTEMREMLKKIEIFFSKSDLNVSKVKMIESDVDYTTIEFTNKSINKKIEDSIFELD